MDNNVQTLSGVVPVYGGESHLRELVQAFDHTRDLLDETDAPLRFSKLFLVLDEPIDKSADVATELASLYDWVDVLTLSRNFGQHPATVAGILHTSSDWVAVLDEDLQHPPEALIPMLRLAVKDGLDLVYGTSDGAVHGGWRDLASRGAKRLVAWLAGSPSSKNFSSFRLIRGEIARAASSVAGHETYLDVAIGWHTTRIGRFVLPIRDHRPGESGYSLKSLLAHMRRLMISSNAKVLRVSAVLGLFAVAIAVLAATWLLIGTVFGFRTAERGWLSTISATVGFGGVLTLSTSILSEYVLNIAQRVQGRPTFFVVDRTRDDALAPWAASDEEPE